MARRRFSQKTNERICFFWHEELLCSKVKRHSAYDFIWPLQPAKETPPNILRGKCNKMCWGWFFSEYHLGSFLGLNSLSEGCVRKNAVYATWRPDLVRWVDKIGIFFVSIWGFLTSRPINLTLGLISGNDLVSSVTKGMFNFSNSIKSIMDWIPLKTVCIYKKNQQFN